MTKKKKKFSKILINFMKIHKKNFFSNEKSIYHSKEEKVLDSHSALLIKKIMHNGY